MFLIRFPNKLGFDNKVVVISPRLTGASWRVPDGDSLLASETVSSLVYVAINLHLSVKHLGSEI